MPNDWTTLQMYFLDADNESDDDDDVQNKDVDENGDADLEKRYVYLLDIIYESMFSKQGDIVLL